MPIHSIKFIKLHSVHLETPIILNSSKSPAIQSIVDFNSLAVTSHVSFFLISIFFSFLFFFHALHSLYSGFVFPLIYPSLFPCIVQLLILTQLFVHRLSISTRAPLNAIYKLNKSRTHRQLYTVHIIPRCQCVALLSPSVVGRQSSVIQRKMKTPSTRLCIQNINRFCVFVFVWISYNEHGSNVRCLSQNSFIINLMHG